ncbi:hypothetical protein RRG08_014163 [Elysia crispata]|uniref:Peptidase A2 domain-containing protein n=1 Tax=Elysia crispata TaxID=231223 RepID=A0AAE0Z0N1_9GAST|nr:hypothetical protein RRG08_014163 [Elysia crispata]
MSRKVDVYDSNVETFQNYAERLEQYFIANDVAEEKRAATLLSCIGAKTYQLLRSLTSPDLPSTKSYDELKVVLNKHLSPQPLEIAERFRFHKRNQREGQTKKVHQLEEGTDFFSIDLQVHQSAVTTNKIWVHPLINNVRIRMKLDTGSGLSLMTIIDYKTIFKKSPSLSTDRSIILNTYTGEKVSPLGYAHVVVTVNGVSKTLPLWIVKEGNNPLFGRNWLQHFRLQWYELKNLKVTTPSPRSPEATTTADSIKNGLQKLLQRHKEVFSPGIGKAKSHTATLTLKPDAKPKFCKARPVPYALVNKVGQELDNLEKQGATDPDLILPISLPKDTTRSQSAEPNPVTVPPPAPTVASTSASPSNLGTQPRRSGRITKPPVKLNL